MPGLAFPPVGPLGLGSPPSQSVLPDLRYYAWLRLPPAPLGSLRLSLAPRYLACSLRLCPVAGSLAAGSSLPTPGLLVSRYPCSSGILNKETDGSLQFPSYPLEYMPRS